MNATNRRRFIAICAASLAVPTGLGVNSPASARSWQGTALGADAFIHLGVQDPKVANHVIRMCLDTLTSLEDQFSLYRQNSALSRLNRHGYLDFPEAVFLDLLSRIRTFHRATNGAFDPTIQPIWDRYAKRFSSNAQPHPAPATVGFDHVLFDTRRVTFAEPGMAMTFNGIAQGFITDKIADLLQAHGLSNVAVSMGEIRTIGPQSDGTPWPVRLVADAKREQAKVVRLVDRSVATSATLGTVFDDAGRFGHIINPRTERPEQRAFNVSVSARKATVADALSTAFCLMKPEAIAAALRKFGDARVL